MAKDTFLYRKTTLNLQGKLMDLATPCVMGILNVTPDSFYANSRVSDVNGALAIAEKHLNDGASFLDIGAYSSRPGAQDISAQEEMDRLLPVVEAIRKHLPQALLSIDTFRADVALESIKLGAHVINDISAGNLDDKMFDTVAELKVPYIMMHMKGTPQTMQEHAAYSDITLELLDYFSDKLYKLKQLGVKDIIIDPGFGFSKTLNHNYELLQRMGDLRILGLPILAGVSRKGMIHKALEITAAESLNGTTVVNTLALLKGANILRVHDVKEAMQCIKLVQRAQQQYTD
ncbi:MAG: dihydropteroate synthase [Bacteroidota bacterium]